MSSVSTYSRSEDLCAEEFVLIALHSSLEDHVLVYTLNKFLKLKLKRASEDLEVKDNFTFPLFEWKDEVNDRYWTLVTNNRFEEKKLERHDLFENELSITVHHLIPEHKEVDFFLKIDQGDEHLEDEVVKQIQNIPKIITAYLIDTEQMKSKHNLIF